MTEPPTSGSEPSGAEWPPQYPPQQPPYSPPPPPGQYAPPPPGQYAPPPPPPPGQYGPTDWETLGQQSTPAPQPARRGRGRLFAAAGVVAALAVGGVVTYVAVSDTNGSGAGNPKAAVQKIVDDINKSDLAGVLDDLAPAERTSVADPILKAIDQLKRIRVLQPDADPKNVAAVKASITQLSFGPSVHINDHVEIVQLTGGTVALAADASKIPFTKDLVNALFPNGQPTGTSSAHVDIAQAVSHNGGHPIRLAAQKVNGRWYPSLFYTIADNAVVDSGLPQPTAADHVPAVGADSPADAVRQAITALLSGDLTRAIQLADPDELAALHDYAGVLLKRVGSHYSPAPVHLNDLQLTPTTSSGNAQRLVLKSISLTTDKNEQIKVVVEGTCLSMTVGQDEQRFCASQAGAQLDSLVRQFTGQAPTPAQRTAFEHLFSGTTKVGGLVATQSGGKWYVAPVRTFVESATSILDGLQGNDVIELVRLFASIAH